MNSPLETFDTEESFTEEARMDLVNQLRTTTAILFFKAAFRNPLKPKYCGQCLYGIWVQLLEAQEDPRCPGIPFPAVFDFIVFGRTEAQMTDLLDGMSHCRCFDHPHDEVDTDSLRFFHENGRDFYLLFQRGPLSTPTPFHSVMKSVVEDLLIILQETNPTKLARQKRPKDWPSSLDEIILPAVGPETTVKSLEQWIIRMGHTDPWPIELLGMIAYAARSLIIPSILHSPTLIPTVLRIAQQMCDDATSHSSQTPSAPIIFIQIVRRLGFIASFFGNIFLRTGGAPEMLDVLPTDRKTGIVQMCARAIDVLRLPLLVQHASEENRTSVINDLTGIFTLMLDEDVSLDGIDPALIRQALESLDRTVHGPPLRQLPLLLVGWKRTMRCYAMSCQESLQTSQTFKRCSACKVISYCGPNCQKLAWAAHKPICKTIAKITRDGGGDIDSEAFRLNCEAGKVDFRDAQVVIDAFSAWRRTHGGIHL